MFKFLSLGSVLLKMAINDHFHVDGKVGRSDATTTKLFSVDSSDLNTMSVGNLVMMPSLLLKCQGHPTSSARWQINILLLFSPLLEPSLNSLTEQCALRFIAKMLPDRQTKYIFKDCPC